MNPVSGAVLFAVVWWMVFFVVLPLGNRSQSEAGEIEPGTPASAPAHFALRRKLVVTTLWAVAIWIVIACVVLSGVIGVHDLDVLHHMGGT